MNWPAKYNSNAACEWEITAPLGHVVLAEVVDFWIGGSTANECTKSNVLIKGRYRHDHPFNRHKILTEANLQKSAADSQKMPFNITGTRLQTER